jgi:DNA-binding transcriptional LysR family regulator
VIFRIGFVPGVTPDKWARIWAERLPRVPLQLGLVDEATQLERLRAGELDMCFVRLPIDKDGLHCIPLYHEVPVVIVPKEHPVAAYDEIDVADLADEHLLQDPDLVPEWRDLASEIADGSRLQVSEMTVEDAVATTAAGAGVMIVPMSVARLYHRKDLVHRPVRGVAESQVGLAWVIDNEDPHIQTFIGIVRGRTERSSRQ